MGQLDPLVLVSHAVGIARGWIALYRAGAIDAERLADKLEEVTDSIAEALRARPPE